MPTDPGFAPCSCRAHLHYENGDGIAIRAFGDHGPDRVRTYKQRVVVYLHCLIAKASILSIAYNIMNDAIARARVDPA